MDLCLGVDTGLVHLAASHDVPVVVLFGPTDPNRWSPWTARATVVRSAQVRRPLFDRLGLTGRPCPRPPSPRSTCARGGFVTRSSSVRRLRPPRRCPPRSRSPRPTES
jgi:hypothetical protein